MRRLHLALCFLLIGLGSAPFCGAASGAISGEVRDSHGVPQIGAQVQLLRPDLSVVSSVYTSSKGRFVFGSVQPGHYAVKAMGAYFLPTVRENVRVRTSTIVNLTLNTLYEVMQWLPAQPRSADTQKDDWAWTLRSAANRPLLRWLEDGPLVVVSDGPRSTPRLKARLMATGQAGAFGEDGQRISAEIEDTPSDSRELFARVDFDPATDAGMESQLGFRQDLGIVGSVQTVAAVALHPEIGAAGTEGLDEVGLESSQTINLGDMLSAKAGADQVMARFAQGSGNTVFAALPMLSVGWRKGDSTLHYRMATAVPRHMGPGGAEAGTYLPAFSIRNGRLALEHGTHHEIGWERATDSSGISVVLYADRLSNPVLEASTQLNGRSAEVTGSALYDVSSGILRVAGPGYSAAGIVAAVQRRLPHGNTVRMSYADGEALVMPAAARGASLGQHVATARPRRAQMYSLSFSGTLEGSGTKWRASYRWQPEETVTRVAPYVVDAAEPFFNLGFRQPVVRHSDGTWGIDAMLDVGNLLQEGNRPFRLTDGSILRFAQNQRSLSAGVAFTF